ncbi:MAG: phosphatase PAP2 family protein [Paracoccaceae bacterium]
MSPEYRGARIALGWLFAVTVAAAVVVVRYPEIDLAVSGWFFDPARKGFYLAKNPFFVAFRETMHQGFRLTAAIALIFWIRSALVDQRVPARIWAFIGLSYLTGPLLLVNVALKGFWGRARPAQVEEFGGGKVFTEAFRITDQCEWNCSFVSGEAAALTTFFLLVAIILWPHVKTGTGRVALAVFCGSLALLTSAFRVLMGRHFLSDSLFGMLFAAIVVIALYVVLDVARYRRNASARDFLADARDMLRFRKS